MNNEQIFSTNVSVDAVERQIERTQKNFKQNVFDEKKYLNLKLNPGETTRTVKIRILPVSATDTNFCTVIKTHSLKLSKIIAKSGFKTFTCLEDSNTPNYHDGVKCPLCEKSRELFSKAKAARVEGKEELSKTIYKEACNYKNKDTYIVRVIERGNESEGVKFWRFNANSKGEGFYDKLIALYKGRKQELKEAGIEDEHNIFDLNQGNDIILVLTRTKNQNGDEGVAVNVSAAAINTPLSNNVALANQWINDSTVWSDAYAVKGEDYLSIIADGKIPYRDKNTGLLVAKEESDFKKVESPEQIAKESDNILKESTPIQSDENDLPF